MTQPVTLGFVRAILDTVLDPEIPGLTIGDLGIVRDVRVLDPRIEVDITPTYSGCPAMDAIKTDIEQKLEAAGFGDVVVRTVFEEAWTTDWITERGRRRLTEFGIAPPSPSHSPAPVCCPQCSSTDVETLSEFGSTACKALMVCESCLEPFDRFKVLEP